MKLQDQVCTEQQAKRLHELGVAQSGYYCYAHRVVNSKPAFNGEMTEWEPEYSDSAELVETGVAVWDGLPFACAFTVAELGIMLGNYQYVVYYQFDNIWYWHAEFELTPFGAYSTEAEARAAILIHMLENNLIVNIDEVNARLCADQP